MDGRGILYRLNAGPLQKPRSPVSPPATEGSKGQPGMCWQGQTSSHPPWPSPVGKRVLRSPGRLGGGREPTAPPKMTGEPQNSLHRTGPTRAVLPWCLHPPWLALFCFLSLSPPFFAPSPPPHAAGDVALLLTSPQLRPWAEGKRGDSVSGAGGASWDSPTAQHRAAGPGCPRGHARQTRGLQGG